MPSFTRHGRAVAVVVRPDVLRSRSRAESALAGAGRPDDLLRAAADSELSWAAGLGGSTRKS
jgi:hypothetical protein